MKVAVIGAGNMGAALVKQLTRAGHTVSMRPAWTGRKRWPQAILAQTAVAAADAAAQAVVVILATGYEDAVNALTRVGNLSGKVVIDIINPLTADYMGLTLGYSTSAAEEIARAVLEAELVKPFNTLFAQVLSRGC